MEDWTKLLCDMEVGIRWIHISRLERQDATAGIRFVRPMNHSNRMSHESTRSVHDTLIDKVSLKHVVSFRSFIVIVSRNPRPRLNVDDRSHESFTSIYVQQLCEYAAGGSPWDREIDFHRLIRMDGKRFT